MNEIEKRYETLWLQQLEITKAYMALREYMPIDAAPGTKVVLWFPSNGHASDTEQLTRLKMKLGDVFTIERTEPHSCSTDVYLKEFPRESFNVVNFGVATAADLLPKSSQGGVE